MKTKARGDATACQRSGNATAETSDAPAGQSESPDPSATLNLDIVALAAAKRAVETGETYGVFDETGLLVFKIEAGEQWRKSDADKLQKVLLHF